MFSFRERELFIEKAKKLASVCVKNNFDGIEVMVGLKVSQLCICYDGIGPEWSTGVIVGIIEHIDHFFEPAAFLLDVQYHAKEDRSVESFLLCNKQFFNNCAKLIKKEYGWWRPKRYRLLKSARILHNACNDHGLDSWLKRGNLHVK